MEMDQELIDIAFTQVKTTVGEFKFPASIYKHVAFRMVKENRLGDAAWLQAALDETDKYVFHKRELAERGGYSPFTFMGKSAYNWIRKNCAEWVITAMETAFRDPEDIHPEWAVQCAKTMSVIGRDECAAQGDLYNYLMQHPEWEIQKEAREQYRREWLRLKRQRENGPQSNPRQQQRVGRNDQQRRPRERDREGYRPQREQREQRTTSAVPGAAQAKVEAVLKIDTLPKGRPAEDRDFTLFEVSQDQLTVTFEVRRSFYDKLCKMTRAGQSWTAVLSGPISQVEAGKFQVVHPFAHIYGGETQQHNQAENETVATMTEQHTLDAGETLHEAVQTQETLS
jgi:hypothetical protein